MQLLSTRGKKDERKEWSISEHSKQKQQIQSPKVKVRLAQSNTEQTSDGRNIQGVQITRLERENQEFYYGGQCCSILFTHLTINFQAELGTNSIKTDSTNTSVEIHSRGALQVIEQILYFIPSAMTTQLFLSVFWFIPNSRLAKPLLITSTNTTSYRINSLYTQT